jgi:hypothetical protein
MDQQEPYWTLAECVAWVRHLDEEAVKGCIDLGLLLEIPDEILQILGALRQCCRDGSLQAVGRRSDPSPDALHRVPYDPWQGEERAQFEPVPSAEWTILDWSVGPRYPRGALSDRSGVLRWVDVAFAKSKVIKRWPASGAPQPANIKKARGPKSQGPRMRGALTELIDAGQDFSTTKVAYAAVMKHLRIPEKTRGWTYRTFHVHCSDLLHCTVDQSKAKLRN